MTMTSARRLGRFLMVLTVVVIFMPIHRGYAPPPPPRIHGPIFVPQPRGAGDTLDTSTKPKDAGARDVVKTVGGDVLNGKVLSIEAEGEARIAGKQFLGDARVRTSALSEVVLGGRAQPSGQDEVILGNGDRLRGELIAVTDTEILLRTGVAGPVKVPRVFAVSLSVGGGASVLLDSDFPSGRMEPWKVRGGSWAVNSGKLTATSSGSSTTVYAPLEQDEAVTFVARVQATGGNQLRCYLFLFAENPTETYGRNSVYGYFRTSQWYLGCTSPGRGTNTVTSGPMTASPRGGTLRLAYDPKTGKAKAWFDARLLGECTIPTKPKKGRYVMLTSRYPSQTSRLQVLRGIVAPSGMEISGSAEEGADVVQLGNKDRVSAKDVALAEGRFTITTDFGELAVKADRVRNIVFRRKGRQKPRRRKGDVQVTTSAGRLTVQFQGLTGEHLVGTSDCWGDVKIRRDAVKKVRFNIYRDKSGKEIHP